MASVSWKKDSGKFIMDINVPVGSTAEVYVPAINEKNVTESGKEINTGNGVRFQENGEWVCRFYGRLGEIFI